MTPGGDEPASGKKRPLLRVLFFLNLIITQERFVPTCTLNHNPVCGVRACVLVCVCVFFMFFFCVRCVVQVERYAKTFWEKGSVAFAAADWERHVKNVEKGERKIEEISRCDTACTCCPFRCSSKAMQPYCMPSVIPLHLIRNLCQIRLFASTWNALDAFLLWSLLSCCALSSNKKCYLPTGLWGQRRASSPSSLIRGSSWPSTTPAPREKSSTRTKTGNAPFFLFFFQVLLFFVSSGPFFFFCTRCGWSIF